jgi:hypothetical protein
VFLIGVRNKDFDAAKICAVGAMFHSVFLVMALYGKLRI